MLRISLDDWDGKGATSDRLVRAAVAEHCMQEDVASTGTLINFWCSSDQIPCCDNISNAIQTWINILVLKHNKTKIHQWAVELDGRKI